MIIEFDWLAQDGVRSVINMVYKLLDLIRIVVPIGLIVMTTLDISKKVINPDDKEGQKKIMIRAIAALLVFLAPTIIHLALRLLNIKEVDIDDITPSNTPIVTSTLKPVITPTPKPTSTPTPTLSSVSITSCPDTSIKYNPGDKIILNTDIPLDFKGKIEWIPDRFHNEFIIIPSSDNKSATLEVVSNPSTTYSTVTVLAGGQASACLINIQKDPLLPSLSITNCPDRSIKYNPGDKIILYTDIPANFKGEIKWIPDSYHNEFNITPSNDNRSATLEVVSNPSSTYSTITVLAGGQAKACFINIQKPTEVSSIKITNCPSNKVFKNGDTVYLKTDIPSSYQGEVLWGWGISDGELNVIKESNQEYVFTISKLTRQSSFSVIATLDATGVQDSCKITMEP